MKVYSVGMCILSKSTHCISSIMQSRQHRPRIWLPKQWRPLHHADGCCCCCHPPRYHCSLFASRAETVFGFWQCNSCRRQNPGSRSPRRRCILVAAVDIPVPIRQSERHTSAQSKRRASLKTNENILYHGSLFSWPCDGGVIAIIIPLAAWMEMDNDGKDESLPKSHEHNTLDGKKFGKGLAVDSNSAR